MNRRVPFPLFHPSFFRCVSGSGEILNPAVGYLRGGDRMEPRVGNKFRLGRKIGSGSFGEIYLGIYN